MYSHYFMLILLLALPVGVLTLPLQMRLSATFLNRKLGIRTGEPSFAMYSVLGAIFALMVGLGIIQFAMAGHALPIALVMPAVLAVFLGVQFALALVLLLLLLLEALVCDLIGRR